MYHIYFLQISSSFRGCAAGHAAGHAATTSDAGAAGARCRPSGWSRPSSWRRQAADRWSWWILISLKETLWWTMKVNIDEINIHQLYTIYIHLLILRCYRIINIVFLFILDGIGFMKVIFLSILCWKWMAINYNRIDHRGIIDGSWLIIPSFVHVQHTPRNHGKKQGNHMKLGKKGFEGRYFAG